MNLILRKKWGHSPPIVPAKAGTQMERLRGGLHGHCADPVRVRVTRSGFRPSPE
jgi:hypothetical protein